MLFDIAFQPYHNLPDLIVNRCNNFRVCLPTWLDSFTLLHRKRRKGFAGIGESPSGQPRRAKHGHFSIKYLLDQYNKTGNEIMVSIAENIPRLGMLVV